MRASGIDALIPQFGASLIAQLVKNLPVMQETPIRFLHQEDPPGLPTAVFLGFPCGSTGKESTCNAGDLGSIHSWEDFLEKGKAIQSSTLAWRIPWSV